ncbi:MAG: monofunctional biosynthetic peptidoglycan transglycosylase [Kiloniellales bacterium]
MARRRKRPPAKGRSRLRRWLRNLALAILIGPPAVILLYGILPPPGTPLMLLRLADGESLTRDWEPLERIDPALARSVIAAEDNLFCQHFGFDWAALGEAFDDYVEGNGRRGASTISQQTAKNLFLWPGRNFVRKGLEAYLTVWLELILTKRRILELYLNVAEWGPGLYGAEAAARHYFGKPADSLSAFEASQLAALLPAPRDWRPGQPWVAERAAVIRRRIGQLGPLLDCAS